MMDASRLLLLLPLAHLSLHQTNAFDDDLRRGLADGPQTRIVGGIPADFNEFPFFASWDGRCGASLIYEDILLTAAHCNPIPATNVWVGALRYKSLAGGAVERTITQRRVHPGYNAETVENDFLLLKLNAPVGNKRPIALNTFDWNPVANEDLAVIGFGSTSEDSTTATFALNEATVQATPDSVCQEQYGNLFFEETMLCAAADGRDACQGDSGGPLVQAYDGYWRQVGVVSWAFGCARPESHGVYSRISSAIDWIDQSICELSSNPPASCFPNPPTARPRTPPPSKSPTPPPSLSPTTAQPSRAPTMAPTPYPTPAPVPNQARCVDDNNSSFRVDALIGHQSCSWLRENLSRYNYLCSFAEVSVRCQVTCDSCRIF